VLDFKDTELVDLLLFELPWLCHGKPQTAPAPAQLQAAQSGFALTDVIS
jgi:hypothetical protein